MEKGLEKEFVRRTVLHKLAMAGFPSVEVVDLPEGFEVIIQYPNDKHRAWYVQSIGQAIDSIIGELYSKGMMWTHYPEAKGGIFRAKIERYGE